MADSDLNSDPLLRDVPIHEGYRVLGGVVLYQKLGKGGMGAVYRGRHLRLDVDVAVKVMAHPFGLEADRLSEHVQRFIREARTAAKIDHPNLVRVFDVDTQHGVYFLVMQFVDGESAGDRCQRKGRLGEVEAIEICLGAAKGVGAAHREGIVHRDIKPDNIMIDKSGRVCVADLGLAKGFASDGTGPSGFLTQTEAAMGTPCYMPPEQFTSAKDVGPQADAWSLGVTLYHLVTGDVPWSDTSVFTLANKIQTTPYPDPREHAPKISDGVCSIIERSLKKEVGERYADCAEMAKALSQQYAALNRGDETMLADPEAGRAKQVLATMTPPASWTMTLIGKSMMAGPGASEGEAKDAASAPRRRWADVWRAKPTWLLPAVGGGILLVSVLLASILGGRGETGEVEATPTAVASAEEEAEKLLARAMSMAGEGQLEEAARLIGDAGAKYDATAAGPKLARLAQSLDAKIEIKARQDAERRRREDEDRRASLMADAGRAEEDGRLSEAEMLFTAAAEDGRGPDGQQAQKRLAEIRKRLEVERVLADVTRLAEAGEWRAVWDMVEKARRAGVAHPSLDKYGARAAAGLAPKKTLAGPNGMVLVLVSGGGFRMGSDTGRKSERPTHGVEVSSFYICRHEVTQSQYQAIMGSNPSRTKGAGLPVETVSWYDAQDFCTKLSARTGIVFRLPREAEWEYAARGATGRLFPWGDDAPETRHANLAGADDGYEGAAPVGSFPAGATPDGVENMAGNVAEWCADWIGPYGVEAARDPAGPAAGALKMKVVRGGAFAYGRELARASSRACRRPHEPVYLVGFRVVRELTDEEREFERLVRGD